jgi:arsenate reductase-like glutaredoxin family protein
MAIVIYHNPECGTSRNVLAIIEAAGNTATVIHARSEVRDARRALHCGRTDDAVA